MNFAVLFLIINLLFFAGVAYYFSILKRELRDERKDTLEDEKLHDRKLQTEEDKIKQELFEAKRKATMILTESEKIAQDLVVELEKTLGRVGKKADIMLPSQNNFEQDLEHLSGQIKIQYLKRIQSMMTALQRYEVREAHKIEDFAQEQEANTDRNLQIIRVESLQKMHDRIESYKKNEVALFDRKVKVIIDKAAKEVLGKALLSTEQEELIFKTLEKLKANSSE